MKLREGELEKKFLSPSKKSFYDKAASPEETLKRVEEALRKSGLKLCSEVKRVDKGRLGIPVYMSFYDVDGVRITGKHKQMGKGITEELAKVSALMELVERFSIFSFVKEVETKVTPAPYESISSEAISIKELISALEVKEDVAIAEKYIKVIPLHYVPAFSFSDKRVKLLPFFWFWTIHEYNGASAGNTYPEAGLQGLCEVIERHASALFAKGEGGLKELEVDLDSPELTSVLEKYYSLGIKLWIRDMSMGLDVPTVAVAALDPSTYPVRSEIVFTAGTSPSPARALLRALTEVAQLAGDFDTDGRYEESGLPKISSPEELEERLKAEEKVLLSNMPSFEAPTHNEELEAICEVLREKGLSIYFLDVENPSLRIPAVYTIVPGALFRDRARLSPLHHLVKVVTLTQPLKVQEELVESLVKEVPERYYIWAYRGRILRLKGKLDEALFDYEKALSLSPPLEDEVAILTHITEVLLEKKEYEKAVELGLRALKLAELPEVYNLVGRAYYKMGDYFSAMDAFLKATELNPASAIDYANIGYCLKAIGQEGAAVIYFQKALLVDPDLTMAKKGLEYCKSVVNPEN